MSVRRDALRKPLQELGRYWACLAAIFFFLGISVETAVLASSIWIALAATGGFIIQSLIGTVRPQLRVLIAIGPGTLLGLGLAVFVYLSVRGGSLGIVVVVSLFLFGTYCWLRNFGSDESVIEEVIPSPLVLFGAALFVNSREFPNLLASGITLLVVGVTFRSLVNRAHRFGLVAVMLLVMLRDVVTRPEYWWWSSDDTTTLAGIGTIIIERGRVADVAGWSTASHHWLLHAWLALWNLLSRGHIFTTYMVAWPIVAALSLCSSIVLCLVSFFHRRLTPSVFAIVAVSAAGLLQLEWAAPQEQHPFVFGLIACCAMWLAFRSEKPRASVGRFLIRLGICALVLPVFFFLLKPTLLVAYALLVLGTALAYLGLDRGYRWFFSLLVSAVAVGIGIIALWLGSPRISQNSFTSLGIQYLPPDLGWCRVDSAPYASLCVLSLQAVLISTAFLSVLAIWLLRHSMNLRISLVMFLPLVVAYLPLRMFISSKVFTGAPSFYRLSEMALMLIVIVGLSGTLLVAMSNRRELLVAAALMGSALALIVWLNRSPSAIYNAVDSWIVRFSVTRYLNASDAIALSVSLLTGLVMARLKPVSNWRHASLVTVLILFALLPTARLVTKNVTTDHETIRLSRPSYLGPRDIEDVGRWLEENLDSRSLLATNFLCGDDRIAECTNSSSQIECPRTEPALMASWALTALSKREFVYLSQFWDSETNYYALHQLSTNLGNDLSSASVLQLERAGVSHYVASRTHSDADVWRILRDTAKFSTENFAVVVLQDLSKL